MNISEHPINRREPPTEGESPISRREAPTERGDPISRRNFLKGAAACVTAATLTYFTGWPSRFLSGLHEHGIDIPVLPGEIFSYVTQQLREHCERHPDDIESAMKLRGWIFGHVAGYAGDYRGYKIASLLMRHFLSNTGSDLNLPPDLYEQNVMPNVLGENEIMVTDRFDMPQYLNFDKNGATGTFVVQGKHGDGLKSLHYHSWLFEQANVEERLYSDIYREYICHSKTPVSVFDRYDWHALGLNLNPHEISPCTVDIPTPIAHLLLNYGGFSNIFSDTRLLTRIGLVTKAGANGWRFAAADTDFALLAADNLARPFNVLSALTLPRGFRIKVFKPD